MNSYNLWFARQRWAGFWLACWAITFAAEAEAPPPPAEFWQYLLEFGDPNAEVIDPLEFAQLETRPNIGNDELPTTDATNNPPPIPAEEK